MDKQVFKRFEFYLTLILLVIWICITPSHFQKGGVEPAFYFGVAVFIALISFLITLLFDKFKIFERTVAAIIFAVVSLFLSTLIITPTVIDLFYQDKTWFLYETKHRLIVNSVYYSTNAVILTCLSFIYFRFRRRMKVKLN